LLEKEATNEKFRKDTNNPIFKAAERVAVAVWDRQAFKALWLGYRY
jgi:hypothetical protein